MDGYDDELNTWGSIHTSMNHVPKVLVRSMLIVMVMVILMDMML